MIKMTTLNMDDAIRLLLLFLIGLNICGIGVHLIILLLLMTLVKIKISLKLKKDSIGIILFLFLLIYAFFHRIYEGSVTDYYYYFFIPFLCYFTGKRIGSKNKECDFSLYVIAPVLGLALWGVLNTYKTSTTSIALLSRQSIDFWAGTTIVSSKQACYFYLLAAIMGIKIWIDRIKVTDCFMLIIIAIGLFTTGTRSLLFVFAGVAFAGFIYLIRSKDVNQRKKNTKVQTIIGVVLVCLILYSLDIFGLATKLNSSTLFMRLTGQADHDTVSGLFDNNGRDLRYALFFSQVLSHPFGNISLGEYGSAHNTFFDIYRLGGVIPSVLFIILMILIYKSIFRLTKKYRYRKLDAIFIVAAIGGLTLAFAVESLMALNKNVMSIFFFIVGILVRLEKREAIQYIEQTY